MVEMIMTMENIEWNKMVSGQKYYAPNPDLHAKLMATREKIYEFNSLRPSETDVLKEIIKNLFGSVGESCLINQPFRCDFGENIYIGDNVVVCAGSVVTKGTYPSNVVIAGNPAKIIKHI